MRIFELGFSAGHFSELQIFNGHRHNDVELNFLLSGQLSYAFAGSEYSLPANCLALFWAAIPHQLITVAPATDFYWVTIPLSNFMNWDLSANIVKGVLNGEFILDSDSEFAPLDRFWFAQWNKDVASGSPRRHKTALLEVEARLRRMTSNLTEGHRQNVSPSDAYTHLSTAQQIAQFIAQHYMEPINCRAIADAVGIHPGYASRIFSDAFDIGIIDYLTQYRISAAQKLLLTTNLRAQQIGFEVGFGSTSRFYAAFKKICGLPPDKYRALLTQSGGEN